MSLSRTLATAGAAVLVSTVLAGCGGDGTLSAKEFRSQANKLCADANKDTETYGAKISQTSSDADVTKAIDRTVERNEKLVADIDALEAPKSMADDVDSMLASVRAGMKELDKISSVQDLTSFDASSGPLKDANDKAVKLGLTTCGE